MPWLISVAIIIILIFLFTGMSKCRRTQLKKKSSAPPVTIKKSEEITLPDGGTQMGTSMGPPDDLKMPKTSAVVNVAPSGPGAVSNVTGECQDRFEKCATWASQGDCSVNPEFMIYNCPKSCKSCEWNDDERWKYVVEINSQPAEYNVRHEAYPDTQHYLDEVREYQQSTIL